MANQKNSTQADFDKQAAIDLVRAEALKVRELHDIFEVSERSICIIKDRPMPKASLDTGEVARVGGECARERAAQVGKGRNGFRQVAL